MKAWLAAVCVILLSSALFPNLAVWHTLREKCLPNETKDYCANSRGGLFDFSWLDTGSCQNKLKDTSYYVPKSVVNINYTEYGEYEKKYENSTQYYVSTEDPLGTPLCRLAPQAASGTDYGSLLSVAAVVAAAAIGIAGLYAIRKSRGNKRRGESA